MYKYFLIKKKELYLCYLWFFFVFLFINKSKKSLKIYFIEFKILKILEKKKDEEVLIWEEKKYKSFWNSWTF